MKTETRAKLEEAERYCNENDKSTEFMIQYMMDFAKVDHDCVMKYLRENAQSVIDEIEPNAGGLDA